MTRLRLILLLGTLFCLGGCTTPDRDLNQADTMVTDSTFRPQPGDADFNNYEATHARGPSQPSDPFDPYYKNRSPSDNSDVPPPVPALPVKQ